MKYSVYITNWTPLVHGSHGLPRTNHSHKTHKQKCTHVDSHCTHPLQQKQRRWVKFWLYCPGRKQEEGARWSQEEFESEGKQKISQVLFRCSQKRLRLKQHLKATTNLQKHSCFSTTYEVICTTC